MDTLRRYTNEYKSLGDPNLTQKEGQNIARIIKKLNDQLMKISNVLYKKIKEMDEDSNENKNNNINLEQVSAAQLEEANNFKEKLSKILKADKIESGEYADNELRVNYAYYHYLLWFLLAAILLGGIVLLGLNVEVPGWPWKGIPILIIGVIGYFIFSRVYWSFQRTLNLHTVVI